jgi:hypothetical protein
MPTMQELGVWTTAEGSSVARLQLESDEGIPSWASGALQGAATGAATGAAAGPYGALIGAVAGAGLGAAAAAAAPSTPPSTTASKPTASAPQPATQPAADGSKAKAIQALQQFASVVPVLVQIVAASGGKESSASGENGSRESFLEADWGPESFQGNWTVP